MSDTGEALGRLAEAADMDAPARRAARPVFRVPSPAPETVKPRRAAVRGLSASFAHALEQRQLFVLLPYAVILGLIASLVAAEPPEPWALAAVALALAAALWLARRHLATARLLLLAASFWTGFSLLALHGALFGTPMLWGSLYGAYQARVDEVVSVTPEGRRIIVSGVTPMAPAKPVTFRRARILVKAGPPLAPGDIIEGPIRFYAIPGPRCPTPTIPSSTPISTASAPTAPQPSPWPW
jgi:competence protein ComEC